MGRRLRPRLRVQRATRSRPALILTDTPRPGCRDCGGIGGIEYPYGDETGEYGGSDWEPCGCWSEDLRWVLLPLPRLPQRWRCQPTGYSDEPPF